MQKAIIMAAFCAVSAAGATTANSSQIPSSEANVTPVVIELFTSQSCSSCVSAAIYFEELAKRPDVVALGWHVDYWNQLQTRDGRWVDPYSSTEYTARQRHYNRNLRATNSVYTPQMVIGGVDETVGSSRKKVSHYIDSQKGNAKAATIATSAKGDSVSVQIKATMASEAYLVYFDPAADTDVSGGENAGVKFVDVNIVTGVKHLGAVKGEANFTAQMPKDGASCAIIVQEPDLGEIRAAKYCPTI